MFLRFTLHGALILLFMLMVAPITPWVISDELFRAIDGRLQTILQINRAVDLRIPALVMSIMVAVVAIAHLYRMRLMLGLSLLSLIADVLMLPLVISVFNVGNDPEWQNLRKLANAITAIFLGLSAYVVVTFKGGTINTYRLMWNERGRWKEIFHLFGFWVHRTCSPLAIMMIPIILLDRGLELLHLKVTRIRKESPRRRPPGLTWPPHHHKPSGLNWPHTS